MFHPCVINSVVMWLCILVGLCWLCVYVALFASGLLPNSETYTHINKGATNICSYMTTELITNRCTIIGYFNKVQL